MPCGIAWREWNFNNKGRLRGDVAVWGGNGAEWWPSVGSGALTVGKETKGKRWQINITDGRSCARSLLDASAFSLLPSQPPQEVKRRVQPLAPAIASVGVAKCTVLRGPPLNPILNQLKGINFYVYVPARELLRNPDYPAPLQPDNLAPLFIEQIHQTLREFVQRDDNCRRPPIVVATPVTLYDVVSVPNTLTVTVRVDVVGSLRTGTAILSLNLFRSERSSSDYSSIVLDNKISAISLDVSERDLTSAIKDFVQESLKPQLVGAQLRSK
jgi:hypothetical protein